MSEHPCSKNTDWSTGSGTNVLSCQTLDKNNPSLWRGQTPGDSSHLRDDHHLKITRKEVNDRYDTVNDN